VCRRWYGCQWSIRKIPKLNTISEFKIIEKYLSNIGTSYNNKNRVIRGVGDDAAVISLSENLIVSTDTSVEEVHFPKGIKPEYAAYRACVTALSDLAAMGSQPLAFQLSLSTKENNSKFFSSFKKGLQDFSNDYMIGLIGGDLVKGQYQISVTVFGKQHSKVLPRNNVNVGDIVCLSGPLGNGLFGMQNFKKFNKKNEISSAYLKPKALIDYGKSIAEFASSAIDVSDGFLQDLGHLSKASNVGFELLSSLIPHNSNLSLNHCLNCGDDYQLIFTVPKKHIQPLTKKMKRKKLSMYQVGKSIKRKKIILDGKITVLSKGYKHF
jgi:thiamine-monophosphate kinase